MDTHVTHFLRLDTLRWATGISFGLLRPTLRKRNHEEAVKQKDWTRKASLSKRQLNNYFECILRLQRFAKMLPISSKRAAFSHRFPGGKRTPWRGLAHHPQEVGQWALFFFRRNLMFWFVAFKWSPSSFQIFLTYLTNPDFCHPFWTDVWCAHRSPVPCCVIKQDIKPTGRGSTLTP